MQWSVGPIVSRECLSAGENMGKMAGGEREREGARCGCRRSQGSGGEVKRLRVPSSRGAVLSVLEVRQRFASCEKVRIWVM